MAKLFIVGTPIGNFNDITLRALETLKNVDVIACEDTRVTTKLLIHFNIKNKKLISYHNFNEKSSSKGIIDIIKKGMDVALVSDAGMPTIADPGFEIIKEAKLNNIEFDIIPGVSALTTSIAASSLGNEFTFLAFGKNKKSQLESQIKSLTSGLYVFFSAPHKIISLLEIIETNQPNHEIFIARELTKIHQSFYNGKAFDLINEIKSNLKGEFTLVLKINEIKNKKINKYENLKNKK